MASQSGEHNELNFTGESAEEAEDFVQAVNRRAYAAGRQRDNTWITEFAYLCFSRKALRWYEALDEETRNDWQLLKRAILAEFTASPPAPAAVPSAAPALVNSPSSLTPAAPPPSAMTIKIGRIRVNSEDQIKRGYFLINTDGEIEHGTTVADSSKANIFEVDTLGRTLKFQGSGDTLAIQGNSYSLSPRTNGYGLMLKSSANGVKWNHTWLIAGDGTITATLLRTDGSQYDAHFFVLSSVLGKPIYVPADKEAFLERYGNRWIRVTLHLEPLS